MIYKWYIACLYNSKCTEHLFGFYQHLLWRLKEKLKLEKFWNLFCAHEQLQILTAMAEISVDLEDEPDKYCSVFTLFAKILMDIGNLQSVEMILKRVSSEDRKDHE